MMDYDQLLSDVVDSKASLADVLRNAKVLAWAIGEESFKAWVDQELAGYATGSDLPVYRRPQIPPLGIFRGPGGAILRDQVLPTLWFSGRLAELADAVEFREGVRQIEAMVESKEELNRFWPVEAVLLARREMVKAEVKVSGGFMLTEVYQPLGRAVIMGILDAIRNRLLEFLLHLRQEFPQSITSAEAIRGIPKEDVSQIFNITIQGDHSLVASGHDFVQSVTQPIKTNDIESVLALARRLGIGDEDVSRLRKSVAEDGKPTTKKIGPRVLKWFGEMTAKFATGAAQTAPTLIAKALAKYYGWE